jgi:hypothetical protein
LEIVHAIDMLVNGGLAYSETLREYGERKTRQTNFVDDLFSFVYDP